MSNSALKYLCKAACFFIAFSLTVAVAAPPQFYTYDTQTGSTMTIILPLTVNPTFNGRPLGAYDEIGAFSKAGLCVGVAVWDSVHNQTIDVVGQDQFSSTADGLNGGDSIFFRVWHYATETEALAVENFSSGGPTYSSNGIDQISSLAAVSSAISDPILSSPSSGTTGLSVVLTLYWGSVSGATSYAVQVSSSAAFGSTVASQTGLSTQAASVGGLAYNTTYYWRATASNASSASFWAGIWSFTTIGAPSAPKLASPTNGATNSLQSLTLSWQTVAMAANYSVQVSTVSTFVTTIINETGLTGVSAPLSSLAYSTAYYWEVNATNIVGTSPWSTLWTFTTIIAAPVAPILATPANGTVKAITSPTLTWGTVTGAASYSLLVSTSASFATTVSSQMGLTGASASLSGLANLTTYYWEVNAADIGGTIAWSSVWSFETIFAPPILALPINGAVGQAVSFSLSWGAETGAISYSLQISSTSTFSTTCSSQSGLTSASLAMSGLAYYTTYYWEVNASNAGGMSTWSNIWSFTTVARLAIPLTNGWFMYSLNLQSVDSSTHGIFGNLHGFILAMDGNDNLYWPSASLDEIGTIHTGAGYWVLDSLASDTLKLTGNPVNLTLNPVSLPASDWNLVAYQSQVNMPITTALASINSQLVLAMDGSSNFYWPAASLNEIGTMTVGKGYYILTSAPASLTYPNAGSSPAKQLSSTATLAKLLNPPFPTHYAKRALTGNFAAFLAPHVEIDGNLSADNCEVGAYDSKGNLVGSGTVLNGQTAFAICGNDPTSKVKNGCGPSERISFKLWNGTTEYPLAASGGNPVYTAKTIITATLAVPASVLITSFNLSRAYPNPFKGSVKIAFEVPTSAGKAEHSIEIDLFDMKGCLVKQLAKGSYQAGHYELEWNCSDGRKDAVGSSMYIVGMKAANFEKRLKLVRVQ